MLGILGLAIVGSGLLSWSAVERRWRDVGIVVFCVAVAAAIAWQVFGSKLLEYDSGSGETVILSLIAAGSLALVMLRARADAYFAAIAVVIGVIGMAYLVAIGWPVLSCALGLLVFAGAGRDSLLGRWKLPLAGGLAAISYSLYLVHKATYHLVQSHWGAQLEGTGLFAFAVYGGTALLAGAALHFAVERPFLQLRRHLPTRPGPWPAARPLS